MFKKTIVSLLLTLSIVTAASAVHAADTINVYLRGKLQSYEQPPVIKDGSTMVPMRAIFEALGATVKWDGENQTIDALKGSTTIRLKIGWKGAYIEQNQVDLDTAPEIINGSTMVPLRFIGEALGEKIEWDADTRSVLISTDKSALPKPYQDSEAYKAVADELKAVIPLETETQLALSDDAYKVLSSYADLFFASDRHKGSLRGKATPVTSGQVEKNAAGLAGSIVEVSSIHIINIGEKALANGETLTIAYGYTGGEVSQITEKWVDPTYYQIFYVGSTTVQKGDKTEVNGVIVGESTISLINNDTGNTFSAPVYAVAAGNFYNFFDLYLLQQEEAKSREWEPDEETAKRLGLVAPEYGGKGGIVLAAKDRKLDMVKWLLKAGTDPNEELSGQTALIVAVNNGSNELIKLLLENGANPNVKDRGNSGYNNDLFNWTPLITAVVGNKTETVRMLLNAGADPNATDNLGNSVSKYAEKYASQEIIGLLEKAKAGPSSK